MLENLLKYYFGKGQLLCLDSEGQAAGVFGTPRIGADSAVNLRWTEFLDLPILSALHLLSLSSFFFKHLVMVVLMQFGKRGSEIKCKCSICCPDLECMGRFSSHLFHKKAYMKAAVTTFNYNI